MRHSIVFLVLLMAIRSVSAESFSIFFANPTEAVPSGGKAVIVANILNPGNDAASYTVPEDIPGQFKADTLQGPRSLRLCPGQAGGAASIPSKGFIQREYELNLPQTPARQATWEADGLNANTVILKIGAPGIAPATTNTPSTNAPATPSDQSLVKKQDDQFDPLQFFKDHIYGYDPFYFIAGTASPNAKFQVSFKYRLFEADRGLGRTLPPVSNLYLGYSQISLWDWNKPSAPFMDSSYKPEILYYHPALFATTNGFFKLDIQSGFQHESNGRDGPSSRSLNMVYIRPRLTLGASSKFQFTLSPKAYYYVGSMSDNPDLADYRGYVDMITTLGWVDNVQLAALGRAGQGFDHGSLQLDLSYPLRKLHPGLTWYLHAQYFLGYGESLLYYNDRSESFRLGISIYR